MSDNEWSSVTWPEDAFEQEQPSKRLKSSNDRQRRRECGVEYDPLVSDTLIGDRLDEAQQPLLANTSDGISGDYSSAPSQKRKRKSTELTWPLV
eukprot:TRINITY_DN14287_c0_g1_i1.p1 TRINITY_DN14287_c0_g1~~TRINITY_DN14287_c0_g1_i1.p1  ORF type:complete len:94 (+),score=17.69 TRINITY_DN14287_c0_g1_i1:40-321(+)